MSNINTNYERTINVNAAKFDKEEQTDENCVQLSNKTAYGLNIIRELMVRGSHEAARKALDELRFNGRLYDSERFFIGE